MRISRKVNVCVGGGGGGGGGGGEREREIPLHFYRLETALCAYIMDKWNKKYVDFRPTLISH